MINLLFQLSNLLVMPFWLLMIALPYWPWTRRIIASPLIIVPPALLYAALVIPSLGSLLPSLANPQLATIAAALGSEAGTTVAWAHFVTFDLFVGRWAYLEGQERRISAWIMGPTLFLILMFGPLGLLVLLAVRWRTRGNGL